MIPSGRREAVLDVLDSEGIDYALTDETSQRGFVGVVTFPLPTVAVEPVLEQLREAGIERDAYTVVVKAETVVSDRFDALEEAYEEEEDTDRIAREELAARARQLAPKPGMFVVMTAISAVVATSGLLLDSPAVVVGSMVIAPLIGPAMATSTGTVLDDEDLFRRGVVLQTAGGILAVLVAALFATALHVTGVVPLSPEEVFRIGEVRERLAPDILSLAIALGAGVAGALSLSSGVSTALVGVMIAAALVPPTAVLGIGIAWGEPEAVIGSGVLVLLNFISINFAALGVLWFQGYRPERWFRLDNVRAATVPRLAVLGLGIVLLSAFLFGVTLSSVQAAGYEENTRSVVTSTLEERDLGLVSMEFTYDQFPVRYPDRVIVTVGVPPGVDPPPIAADLADRVNDEVSRPVVFPPLTPDESDRIVVEARFVVVESSVAGAATSPVDDPLLRRPAVGVSRGGSVPGSAA